MIFLTKKDYYIVQIILFKSNLVINKKKNLLINTSHNQLKLNELNIKILIFLNNYFPKIRYISQISKTIIMN